MSLTEHSNFVVSGERAERHQMCNLSGPADASADNHNPVPFLGSPFAEPVQEPDDQPIGWASLSTTDPVDGVDEFDLDDFLALDGDTHDVIVAALESPLSTTSHEVEKCSTRPIATATASTPSANLPATATYIQAAEAEIEQLKATLAAESSMFQLPATPRARQNCSSGGHGSIGNDTSPPKRQATTQMGPIEMLWSHNVTKDERRTLLGNLTSPPLPKPSLSDFDFSLQPFTSHQQDLDISADHLRSLQGFLQDKPVFVDGTSLRVDNSLTSSGHAMSRSSNTKVTKLNRPPLKHPPTRSTRVTAKSSNKVSKKPRATFKKSNHQHTASTTSTTVPSPAPPTGHRSINELLAANFYSLNEQEKCRVLLPMLRNIDPRQLEASLDDLPCIQAKGPGHGVRVVRAIQKSPPTPEGDECLATKLTTGNPPSPPPADTASTTSSPNPFLQSTLIS